MKNYMLKKGIIDSSMDEDEVMEMLIEHQKKKLLIMKMIIQAQKR